MNKGGCAGQDAAGKGPYQQKGNNNTQLTMTDLECKLGGLMQAIRDVNDNVTFQMQHVQRQFADMEEEFQKLRLEFVSRE